MKKAFSIFAILCSVYLIYSDASTIASAPKTLMKEAQKKDYFYNLSRTMNMSLAIWSQLYAGDNDHISVSKPLSNVDKIEFQNSPKTSIGVDDGAEDTLFDDPNLFRKMQFVSLRSSKNNAKHLEALALNYPQIESLCISQTSPFSAEGVASLNKFKHLKRLELWCPFNSQIAIKSSLPKSLTYLQIEGTWELPCLPNLTDLRINCCRANSEYFERLETSNLERLYFSNVDIATGAFLHLSKFKRLREIELYNSNMDLTDLSRVSKLGYISILSYESEAHRNICWKKAEKNFPKKKFQEAIDWYKECIFCTPTSYGYLQFARCHSKLGDEETAANFRNCANQIDTSYAQNTERLE